MKPDKPVNLKTQRDMCGATSSFVLQKSSKGRSSLRIQLFQCGLVTALALASYLFISHFVLQSVEVVGVSMSPTLKNSGFYLLNRCVYLVRSPHPSDIVVIRDPVDQSYSVKRIVAEAGDAVYLKDGRIYVNGRELIEPYLPAGMPTYTGIKENEHWVRCHNDEYFLLGDNRLNSADSRVYGPVPRRNILGAIIH